MPIIHGHACRKNHSKEYDAWVSMRYRCFNLTSPEFHNYGGRGIKICERWASFSAFFADMGPKPSHNHSLDRIDVDGPYSPDNCRWATRKEQCRNMRRNVVITAFGKTQTVPEWADEIGCSERQLRGRISNGWSPEKALTPLSGRKKISAIHTINGESMSVTEWAEKLGIPANTIFTRLSRGWSVERALAK